MSSLASSLAWLVALLTLLHSQGPSLLALGPAMVLLYRLAARLMAPRRIGAQEDLNVIIGEGGRAEKPASASSVLGEHIGILQELLINNSNYNTANSLFCPRLFFS